MNEDAIKLLRDAHLPAGDIVLAELDKARSEIERLTRALREWTDCKGEYDGQPRISHLAYEDARVEIEQLTTRNEAMMGFVKNQGCSEADVDLWVAGRESTNETPPFSQEAITDINREIMDIRGKMDEL